MYTCTSKTWFEDPSTLFCDLSIIPKCGMSLNQTTNTLTRLLIVIFILMYVFKLENALTICLVGLLFIIIMHLIKKHKMEAFTYCDQSNEDVQMTQENKFKALNTSPTNMSVSQMRRGPQTVRTTYTHYPDGNSSKQTSVDLLIDRPTTYRFCNDEVRLDGPNGVYNNPEYVSINQKLAGNPNPKTLYAPVVVAPPADLSYWKANNLVNHSHINSQSNIDLYQSGYVKSTCCGHEKPVNTNSVDDATKQQLDGMDASREHFQIAARRKIERGNIRENFEPSSGSDTTKESRTIEEPGIRIKPSLPGQVNTGCGYNPLQLYEAGLPTNYPAGTCEKQPVFKAFNDNLFTQTIQPGTYVRNEINEPINSNIGISFQQQFEPTTYKKNNEGDVLFVQHDPRLMGDDVIEPNYELMNAVNESNVYDPRYSGYGTSYRAYTDDQLGQTKYFYDDVNAIRMPNYIVRSKIDNFPFMDSYGPMTSENGNVNTSVIRDMANKAWDDSNLEQRTSLQYSLMRKYNVNGWQQRMAPIRTSGSVGSNMSRR